MALNAKQKQFVQEYLKDKNGSRAARAAKYSKKTAGSQAFDLLKKPEIQKAIEAGLAKQLAKAELTGDMIIAQLRKHAFVELKDAYTSDGKLLNPHQMPEDIQAALSGLETEELREDGYKLGEVKKVKLTDRIKALELLGKHFKLFTDVSESKSLVVSTENIDPAKAAEIYKKIKEDC